MEHTAVLFLDLQNAMIRKHPYHRKQLLENAAQILHTARSTKTKVVFIQHTDHECPDGSDAWEIVPSLAPLPKEKTFNKHSSSAFKDTALKEYLDSRGIRTLILVGLETEYTIDTTCKVAAEYGYSVIIPTAGTSSFDTCFARAKQTIRYFEEAIWAGRYAAVLSMSDVLKKLEL